MARIRIIDLYLGEGPGEKDGGILNAVMQKLLSNGVPEGCDEKTWIELLTVKQTFLTAIQMEKQGDGVSELSDAASPFTIGKQGETSYCGSHQSATVSSCNAKEVRK